MDKPHKSNIIDLHRNASVIISAAVGALHALVEKSAITDRGKLLSTNIIRRRLYQAAHRFVEEEVKE